MTIDPEAIRRAVRGLRPDREIRDPRRYFTAARRESIRRAALALQKSRPEQAAGILRKVAEKEYLSRVRKAERFNNARS